MLKEAKQSDEDIILDYLTGAREDLPSVLDSKRKLYDYILVQLMEHRPDKQIVELLKRLPHFGLKRSQAYESIKKAKYIHGSYFTVDKGFELYQQLQDSTLAIKWAIEAKDSIALTRAIDVRNKILQMVPEQSDLPLSKMGNKQFFMVLNMNDNSALKLDMKFLEKMSPDEREKLLQEIAEPMIDHNYQILEENVRSAIGK